MNQILTYDYALYGMPKTSTHPLPRRRHVHVLDRGWVLAFLTVLGAIKGAKLGGR